MIHIFRILNNYSGQHHEHYTTQFPYKCDEKTKLNVDKKHASYEESQIPRISNIGSKLKYIMAPACFSMSVKMMIPHGKHTLKYKTTLPINV